MVLLSNHSAGFLKTAGSNGQLLPPDEAMSGWIKRLVLRGGLLCGDCARPSYYPVPLLYNPHIENNTTISFILLTLKLLS